MTVSVRELQSTDDDAYRRFVTETPDESVYASLEFRDFLCAIVGGQPRYHLAVRDGRIAGVLPTFETTAPGVGTIVNSLPWYGSHGSCLLQDPADDEVRRALLFTYRREIDDSGTLSATLVLLPSEEAHLALYRDALHPAAEDSRIGQVTELPSDGADLETRLERTCLRKTRNLVRKALAQGFECAVRDDDDAWHFLHRTHDANIRAVGGRPKPWSHFEALRRTFQPTCRPLYIATLDGEPVAAMLLIQFRTTVEYITPAIVAEYRNRQPLSALIHHAMVDAIRGGYRWWNWGGTWTAQPTLYHFKHGWGADDRPYSYLICSADGGRRIRDVKDRLTELFPFYYAYPYDRLR